MDSQAHSEVPTGRSQYVACDSRMASSSVSHVSSGFFAYQEIPEFASEECRDCPPSSVSLLFLRKELLPAWLTCLAPLAACSSLASLSQGLELLQALSQSAGRWQPQRGSDAALFLPGPPLAGKLCLQPSSSPSGCVPLEQTLSRRAFRVACPAPGKASVAFPPVYVGPLIVPFGGRSGNSGSSFAAGQSFRH